MRSAIRVVVRREAPNKQRNTSPCNTTAQRRHHHKRLRYWLESCHKYSVTLTTRPNLPNFQKKTAQGVETRNTSHTVIPGRLPAPENKQLPPLTTASPSIPRHFGPLQGDFPQKFVSRRSKPSLSTIDSRAHPSDPKDTAPLEYPTPPWPLPSVPPPHRRVRNPPLDTVPAGQNTSSRVTNAPGDSRISQLRLGLTQALGTKGVPVRFPAHHLPELSKRPRQRPIESPAATRYTTSPVWPEMRRLHAIGMIGAIQLPPPSAPNPETQTGRLTTARLR